MKVGVRTPSVKRRIKARTTGRVKRSMKRAVNPLYGKKGMGMIRDPKKAIYNKVYKKTTISVDDILTAGAGSSSRKRHGSAVRTSEPKRKKAYTASQLNTYSRLFKGLGIGFLLFALLGLLADVDSMLGLGIVAGGFLLYKASSYKKQLEVTEYDSNPGKEYVVPFDFNEEAASDITVDVETANEDQKE